MVSKASKTVSIPLSGMDFSEENFKNFFDEFRDQKTRRHICTELQRQFVNNTLNDNEKTVFEKVKKIFDMLEHEGIKQISQTAFYEYMKIRTENKQKTKKINQQKEEIINEIKEEHLISQYEFNPDKVIRNKIFPISKINQNLFGYGIFLPKYEQIKNKEGEVTHTEQIFSPLIIASDGKIHPVSKRFEEEYKIKFNDIPPELELRWSLPSIKKYLSGNIEEIKGQELFEEIKGLYEKYMYFQNPMWYSVHALWDIGTYFFILFRAYPLMELRGIRGSAKTKVMTISNALTFNGCPEIMINPSESSLFRETHTKRITKYIDEAEDLFQVVKGKVITDDRVTFINQSYFWKGAVPRQEKLGNKFITKYYSAYSPTMIGSINGLRGATENRAIVHITTKNPYKDKRGDLEPDTEDTIFEELKDKLYLYALQNWKEIEKIYMEFQNNTQMKSRDFQIWKPLLCIAQHLNDELFTKIITEAEKLTKVKEEPISENSKEYLLLKCMYELLTTNQQHQGLILIKDIRKKYPSDDYKPHNKTIGRILDGLGFMEKKDHSDKGNGYDVSFDFFKETVNNINPSIFPSFHSDSSELGDENEFDNEETEETEQKKHPNSEANEANEESESEIVEEEFVSDGKSLDDLRKFILKNPKDNAVQVDETFDGNFIKNLKEEGSLIETPAGTYRLEVV